MTEQDAMTASAYPKNYNRQWAVFLLLAGAAAWLYWVPVHVSRARPELRGSGSTAATDSFLILRLPEVQAGQDLKAAHVRIAKWMTALDREGFPADALIGCGRSTSATASPP